jgi:hypothetical protein
VSRPLGLVVRRGGKDGGFGSATLQLLRPPSIGVCHAPNQLLCVRAADFNRSRILPTMRPPQSRYHASSYGTDVLLLFGTSNHEVPELRRAQLRPTPPVYLRGARPWRGIRTPVRKLSLLRRRLEGGWLGFRGNRADLRFGNVVADGALIRKSAEPAPTADRPREHGDSSDNVKPA